MPVQVTYPGVYIEEIPSGVRTITGVATSITAFLGRAVRGPTNDPTAINNFGDFERSFGGLHPAYPMGYAVRDFFLNGGRQALIVRLYKKPPSGEGIAGITVGSMKLVARSPGAWGNRLKASVETGGITEEVAKLYGVTSGDLFNLRVAEIVDGKEVPRERMLNLSVKDAAGARRVDRALEAESSLVRLAKKATGEPDLPTGTPSGGGQGQRGDDGQPLKTKDDYVGSQATLTGLYALDKADLVNLLCIPPDARDGDTPIEAYKDALKYCKDRRSFLIVDPPVAWGTNRENAAGNAKKGLADLGITGEEARNAALYFPRVVQADPMREDQPDTFVPCGLVAGLMARTDATRGVWKAPAGIDAALTGVRRLQVDLNNDENGQLNPLGINCLRAFPVTGRVVWGARTLRGADQLADEYKYVPVRRLALYIEESLYRGTQWVVFEPNDEPLWAQIRLNVGAFMHNLFRQGAFQGRTPRDAYFVKCDRETTTQNDINLGIVNIVVGFAPLKPAEFVIIKIQQMTGEIET
ncbi:phage tail sheath subtilisin-like domain-containing protein [Candidatus Binatia bacterium]|nr:phage tail sheath subtilisin-like domain-containing protein [Candidatus Binatia bacterium]